MFAFSQIEPQTTGRISRWDVPLNRWLGVKFGEGQDATIGRAWERFIDDQFAEGDMLSPEQAQERYNLPTLKFDRPVREQEAYQMYERKRHELSRLAYLEAATHSAVSGKGIAGFGAMLLGGLSHPIDAGLIFMPLVGSSAKAAQLGRAGAGGLRQAFARGLITSEQLANISKYPRFTAAVVEGTIGQAIVEIPVYAQKRKDSAIYGIEDAIINVVAGGAFAGGIHAAAKGLSRALEISGLAHKRLTPETKDLIQREAVQAFVEGRPIEVRDIVQVDEAAIRAKVVADIQAEASGSTYYQAGRTERGGIQYVTESKDLADKFADGGEFGRPGAITRELSGDIKVFDATRATAVEREQILGTTNLKYVEPDGHLNFDAFERDAAIQERLRAAGYDGIKISEGTSGTSVAVLKDSYSKLAERRTVDASKKAEDIRAERIQDAINNQMPERLAAARSAEISRQQAEGKILSDEQVEAYKADPNAENAAAFLDEDISTIEQDLKADNERRLAELGDEADEAVAAERAALQEELDAELAELKETAYQPRDKAIKAAIPCAMEVIGGQ